MTFKDYVRPQSLEEAWQLNQKRTNHIVGGMLWMKMSRMSFNKAIDLSDLQLSSIEETETEYRIGCMVSLHELECHKELNELCDGAIREALKSIVGIQFRNCATIGGSLFGRYGFSDVLTVFMALDAEVCLYKAGQMSLEVFSKLPYDNDILTHIIVKKQPRTVVYLSQRNTKTDFPVLNCALTRTETDTYICIGARPARTVRVNWDGKMSLEEFVQYIQKSVVFGSNMRASAQYRRLIAGVLVKRCWALAGGNKQ